MDGPAHFGERHKQGGFCRLDQLSPLIHLARPTVQALPAIAACAYYLTRLLIDEAMAQGPWVRAKQQRVHLMLLSKDCLFFYRWKMKTTFRPSPTLFTSRHITSFL